MPNYRRAYCPGGTWFFTVNLWQRKNNNLLVRHIDLLREAICKVKLSHPFNIHGWVVLPDHMHCVMQLPVGDSDFSLRWRLIKSGFSRSLFQTEFQSRIRQQRKKRGIWQRRFWGHLIRDEVDYVAHMDYVHIKPVKHGYVNRVIEWPYSTFHRLVRQGVYPATWAGSSQVDSLVYDD